MIIVDAVLNVDKESEFVAESLYQTSFTEQTLRDPYHPYTGGFPKFPLRYEKVVIKNIIYDTAKGTIYIVNIYHDDRDNGVFTSFQVYPTAMMNDDQFRNLRGKNLAKKLSL